MVVGGISLPGENVMKIKMRIRDENILGREDVDREFELDGEKLKNWVERLWKAVFGNNPKVEVRDNPIGDEDIPDFSLVIEDSFTIYPGNVKLTDEEMAEQTIEVTPNRWREKEGKDNEVVRLILGVAIPVHNYPSEPDDVDDVDLAYSTSFSDLIDRMVTSMAKQHMSYIWEQIGLEQMMIDEKEYENWLAE
jgi:hypothetical protein